MNSNQTASMRQTGFTMIEVLVAIVIVVLGLLGLAGLQVRMQQSEFESYQRVQAVVLLYDLVERISVNRETASCFAITNAGTGAPYFGATSAAVPACGASALAATNAMADAAIAEWDSALEGAAETKGGASVGAIVGARGCVSYDATTELPSAAGTPMAGTGIYTATVSWLGTGPTVQPTVNCANGLYPPPPNTADEKWRRSVSTTFRLAELN